MWPTPTVFGNNNRKTIGTKSGDGLATAVKLWPTPTASLGTKGGRVTPRKSREGGTLVEAVSIFNDMGIMDVLNPEWVEWLMGWPIGWTSLAALHEREFEHWQAANSAHGAGGFADELWFDEEAGAPSGDHGARQAIPRVSSGVQARAARLKAIGNGQVPRAAAMAWRELIRGWL